MTTWLIEDGGAAAVQSDFQFALDHCAAGDVIKLADSIDDELQVQLPIKAGSPPVRIMAESFEANSTWPDKDQRMTAAASSGLPALRTPTAGTRGNACIWGPTYPGGSDYRFEGIRFLQGAGSTVNNQCNHIYPGDDPGEVSGRIWRREALPALLFNQCFFDGNDLSHYGIYTNGGALKIHNSYFRRFFSPTSTQSPAIQVASTPGPIEIWNTTLEYCDFGLFGGGGFSSLVATPRFEYNIRIGGSYFKADLDALSRSSISRSHMHSAIEMKFFIRLLVQGCLFDDKWEGGFSPAINFNVASGGGQSDPEGWMHNSLFRYNRFRRCAGILGVGPSVGTPTAGLNYGTHTWYHNLIELYNSDEGDYVSGTVPIAPGHYHPDWSFYRNTVIGWAQSAGFTPTVISGQGLIGFFRQPPDNAASPSFRPLICDNVLAVKLNGGSSGPIFAGSIAGGSGAENGIWDGVTTSSFGGDGGIKRCVGADYTVSHNAVIRSSAFGSEDVGSSHPTGGPYAYADAATVITDNLDFTGPYPRIKVGSTWLTANRTGGPLGADPDLLAQYLSGVEDGRPTLYAKRAFFQSDF